MFLPYQAVNAYQYHMTNVCNMSNAKSKNLLKPSASHLPKCFSACSTIGPKVKRKFACLHHNQSNSLVVNSWRPYVEGRNKSVNDVKMRNREKSYHSDYLRKSVKYKIRYTPGTRVRPGFRDLILVIKSRKSAENQLS